MPTVTIEDKKLSLTNLDKVMYPETGFTKAQVIDYYRKVANYMLPHLKDRPITLKRYPNGVQDEHFYEKNCPSHRPAWVTTLGKSVMETNYCLINDLPSLIWLANLASIEIHANLAKKDNLDMPTLVVFDLDPGEPANLLDCLEISLIMRDMFEDLSLKCFAKTSGGKGLHLYLPLNTPVTYDQTEIFAQKVAQAVEKFYPDKVLSKMKKELRKGKVFIDWSQNVRHKTTVCIYSLRAKKIPTVSMPASWQQIESALKDKNAEQLICGPDDAVKRLHHEGDLFEEVLTLEQTLPTLSHKKKSTNKTSLKTYKEKRDFKITPEPSSGKPKKEGQIFVIHKHDATRLHYDLRLEAEGVLKSWAVPKNPLENPYDRHLAIQTEDHPYEYKDFEGEIPEGQYGAGTVEIWDKGTYQNVSHKTKSRAVSIPEAIENGKVEIIFNGQKMKGTYALVRFKQENNKSEWLLIKKKIK